MLRTVFHITCLLLVAVVPAIAADGWGSVSGRILWKGDIPEPRLLHPKGASIKNGNVCAADDVYDDELVIDQNTRGISHVFVYLRKAPKQIHPDRMDFPPMVTFDQKNCMFTPHTLLVRAGQTVEVLNSDSVSHNTNMTPIRNRGQNQVIAPLTPKGKGTLYPVPKAEPLPSTVKCDFHPWMEARWLILDHPYAAITKKDGSFEIKDLPVGTHNFRVWHELQGYLERKLSVEIKDGKTIELEPREYRIKTKD
ncbi:MAG: hypothetical protein MK102_13345 [Fuerstiella sp.]|nr:hypothetical protein [Fuerstiella sp.]